MAETIELKGVQAAVAMRLNVGKVVHEMPPVVVVEKDGYHHNLVKEAMTEMGRKGAEVREKRRAERRALAAEQERVSALATRLEKLIAAAEAAPAPQVPRMNGMNGHSNGIVQAPAPQPPPSLTSHMEMFVGALVYRRAAKSNNADGYDRVDAVAVIDRVEGDILYGRQIGGMRHTLKVRWDSFVGSSVYRVIRMPNEMSISWPGRKVREVLGFTTPEQPA